MNTINNTLEYLKKIFRFDLVSLLSYSSYEVGKQEMWFDISDDILNVYSPPVYTQALSSLTEQDHKRIIEAIINPNKLSFVTNTIKFYDTDEINGDERSVLFAELITQKNLLISVATGGNNINDVNDYYKARRYRICESSETYNIENPNPFDDLWDWYHKWKSDFPTYAERRKFINDLYKPIIKDFPKVEIKPSKPRELTGWERVDRALEKAHSFLPKSKNEEDYQSIGLLCREVIISLGQAVYDPEKHKTEDNLKPSKTDSERMINAFLLHTVSGKSMQNIRSHAKASLKLTLELQHKRTASFTDASLCLEATSSIVNILSILSGLRNPKQGT